ncbi:MAG: CoA transferase [Bacteroidota bacterium]|nr:CoA transferase [Bacteroidota bacterium]
MSLPLSKIRVLDFTRILSGPYCTMKLGDMGAEIIKIEARGSGDDTRYWAPPYVGEESVYFLSVNRNKQSITLDLKSKEGKEIIKKLIRKSDIVVENFRAGVMDKLGFDYKSVKKINPKIVYCSISGYGQTSEQSHQPSFDLVVQGESGFMDITGFPDASPTKAGVSLADIAAGHAAFEGILLALFHRQKTGKGQYIDISLLDSLISMFTFQSQIALSTATTPKRKGNLHPTITPYETFETKEGYINIAAGNEGLWKNFCKAINRLDLLKIEKFIVNPKRVENRVELQKELIPVLKQKTSAEWFKIFAEHDVPVGKINTVKEALNLPTVLGREMVIELNHSTIGKMKTVGNPIKLSSVKSYNYKPAPTIGEHSDKILKQLGYSKKEIEKLKSQKVV